MNKIPKINLNKGKGIQKQIWRLTLSVFLMFPLSVIYVHGQDLDKLKSQSWMKIMQDEASVNFFTAQKDYSKFKKAYIKDEAKKEAREKKKQLKHPTPNESHLENPEESLMMAYEKWARSMKPFVTKDGSVMPLDERLKMVQKKKTN